MSENRSSEGPPMEGGRTLTVTKSEQGRTRLLYRYYCMIKHGALHTRDAAHAAAAAAAAHDAHACKSAADAHSYTSALLPSRQREGITSAHISHSCFVTWFVCVYTHIHGEKGRVRRCRYHSRSIPREFNMTGRCGHTSSQRRA